jgi:hypothetical protein
MTAPERQYMINILKNVDPIIFRGRQEPEILTVLAGRIAEQIVRYPCKPDTEVDVHEMQKSIIGVRSEQDDVEAITQQDFTAQVTSNFANQTDVSGFLGIKSFGEITKIFAPDRARKFSYIQLDTRYRILDNDGTQFFKWNFINTETTTQGSVNAIGNIRDITAMRIYPVKIPYKDVVNNDYGRVTVFIEEFSAQSFIAQEGRRFHFAFGVNVQDRWVELNPENYNDGYFRFRTPITRLDTLTISIAAPLERVVFDTDRMLASVSNYGAATTQFTTTAQHNLETGDRIYVSNFTTANPNTDLVIVSNINSSNGYIVNVIDDFIFTIPVASNGIRTIGTGTVAVTNGITAVVGTGTTFLGFINPNDVVEISGSFFTVSSVPSNTQFIVTTPVTLATASGLTFYRNNTLASVRPNLYFGSKRIFFALELEFLETTQT